MYWERFILGGLMKKKRGDNPLTCSKCKNTKPADKYYPYCSADHWSIAVRAEPE